MKAKRRIRYAAMLVGFLLATLTAVGASDPGGRETLTWPN